MAEILLLTAKLKEERDYWLANLSGEIETSNLVTDFKRPKLYSPDTDAYEISLAGEVYRALKALTGESPFLLYTTLLSALNVCLHKYRCGDRIVVGSPRVRLDGGDATKNALAIACEVESRMAFRELLMKVREKLTEAYSKQDYPYENLIRDLSLGSVENRCPLFDVALALEELHESLPEVKNDITITFRQGEQQLIGTVRFNTGLFKKETIERFTGHFVNILQAALNDTAAPINTLPSMTGEELQQLLFKWNETHSDYAEEICMHRLFEIQAERTPDAPALVAAEETLSYRELNTRANQLAHYLQGSGVGPEVTVGICTDRAPHMIVAILAALKAGGAYVPLDPTYPQQRLAFMLEDASVHVLLTEQALRDALPERAAQTICLDSEWAEIAHMPDENPSVSAVSRNLAYVIYTSGSTGNPKGVGIEHRSAVAMLHWAREVFSPKQIAGVLASTSICFDLSVFEIFVPLSWGGTIVLAEKAMQLPNLSAAREVTLINTVPSAISELLKVAGVPDSVRTVNLAGEPLPHSVVQQLYEQEKIERVYNLYGPSEDTTYSTFALMKRASDEAPTIGRPVSNTQAYILDADLQPVPIGAPGELCLSGDGLARGYFNRADLTAEKFVPHPFATKPGSRLYRTGDMARYLSDGELEYRGRFDHQVKLRGFRIELGEIETVLRRHASVGEAVVLIREDVPGSKRIVAYFVPTSADAPTVSELRHHLKETLPDYMIPTAFVLLDALPLNRNGKIDRSALPAPGHERPHLEQTYVAPRTPEETVLAAIWEKLLGIEQVGINDNFFELGGDSIISIQVVAQANQAGLRIFPKQLFQYQTVGELAAVSDSASEVNAEQGQVTGAVPLTPSQHWFFEQQLPDPHHYNMAYLFEVREDLKSSFLRRAVAELARQHDALRLRFRRSETGWQQFNIGFEETTPFTLFDLSELTQAGQRDAVESIGESLQSSLDLSGGPLMRVAFFEFGGRRANLLLIIIHHLVVDGVSWRILLEDLGSVYRQLSMGESIELPEKTTSFKRWATSLSEQSGAGMFDYELDYWLAEGRKVVAPLPVDFREGKSNEESARFVTASLSVEETRALLHEVPQAYHTQINDALLTALAQAFARWTGAPALLVDIEGHGREEIVEEIDVSRTVGWFTSFTPVFIELDSSATPGASLRFVKEQLRRIPNRGIGYGLLRYLHTDDAVREKLAALPKAEVSFNYLGQLDRVFDDSALHGVAGDPIGRTMTPEASMPHLLYISGNILQGQLDMRFKYSAHRLQRATVEALAGNFIEALRAIINDCGSAEGEGYTPSDFSLAPLDQDQLDKALSQVEFEGA